MGDREWRIRREKGKEMGGEGKKNEKDNEKERN